VNVVDSSAWLEYLAGTDRAELFAEVIEDSGNLIVPAISIYEVYKKVLRERGEDMAAQVFGLMNLGRVVELDATLALEAARLLLPMADSIIYATALRHDATLWTQDAHFEGIQGVRYFRKQII
jgi:predicted nucleic acid-binding protein